MVGTNIPPLSSLGFLFPPSHSQPSQNHQQQSAQSQTTRTGTHLHTGLNLGATTSGPNSIFAGPSGGNTRASSSQNPNREPDTSQSDDRLTGQARAQGNALPPPASVDETIAALRREIADLRTSHSAAPMQHLYADEETIERARSTAANIQSGRASKVPILPSIKPGYKASSLNLREYY